MIYEQSLRDNYHLDNPAHSNPMPVFEQMYLWSKDKLLEINGSLPQRFEQLDFFKQKKYEPRTVQPT